MHKLSILIVIGLLLITSGCATATPSPSYIMTQTAANTLINTCDLLDSRDLANLFTSHTEVILPKPQVNDVEHPIFSAGHASGTETSCIYYAFYHPGLKSEVMLQVNYWLDVPAPNASSAAWFQDWTQAKSVATQTVSGLGNEAFFNNGQLTFKMDNWYVTVEATETDLDLKTPVGVNQQVAIEKQIAIDMLDHQG
jgi:hypothetical protein